MFAAVPGSSISTSLEAHGSSAVLFNVGDPARCFSKKPNAKSAASRRDQPDEFWDVKDGEYAQRTP